MRMTEYELPMKPFEDYTPEEHRELCYAAMKEIKNKNYRPAEEVFAEIRAVA